MEVEIKLTDTIIIEECVDLLDHYIYENKKIDPKTISHIELCLKEFFRESIDYFQVKKYMLSCLKISMFASAEEERFAEAYNYQKIYNFIKSYHNNE
jgi:hypothetical protein